MKIENLFFVGTHRYSFRAGEPAEIIGVEMATDEKGVSNPCFVMRFVDGATDSYPIFEPTGGSVKSPYYELITGQDVREGKIPQVIY